MLAFVMKSIASWSSTDLAPRPLRGPYQVITGVPSLRCRLSPGPRTASIGTQCIVPGRRFPPDDPVPRTEGDDSPPLLSLARTKPSLPAVSKAPLENSTGSARGRRPSRVPLSRSLCQRQPAAQTRPPLHRIRSGARLVRCAGFRSWRRYRGRSPQPRRLSHWSGWWMPSLGLRHRLRRRQTLPVSAHAILFTYEGIAQCTRMSTSLHRQIGL
jgi:hypothetical protein